MWEKKLAIYISLKEFWFQMAYPKKEYVFIAQQNQHQRANAVRRL